MNPDTNWFEEYKNDPDYQFELTSIAVGEEVVEALLRLGITRSELAERLRVSRPRISQILAGDENLTLRTLVGLAVALDARLKIHFEPVDARAKAQPVDIETWVQTSIVTSAAQPGNRQLALAA